MPNETQQAVDWALSQGAEEPWEIVDKAREYFNTHKIAYETFSYDDLIPFLTFEDEEE